MSTPAHDDDRERRHRALIQQDERIGTAAQLSLSRQSLTAMERLDAEFRSSTSWRLGRAIILPLHRLRAKLQRQG